MVYIINPSTPKTVQVKNVVMKELANYPYKYIAIGGTDTEVAKSFYFEELTTIFVQDPESEPLNEKQVQELQDHKILYLKGEHSLRYIFQSVSHKFRTLFLAEIMAKTITLLEKNIQECIEVAVTGVDRKIIPPGERIIAITGEQDEPDTAVVIEPGYSSSLIDTKMIKILCHPYHEGW